MKRIDVFSRNIPSLRKGAIGSHLTTGFSSLNYIILFSTYEQKSPHRQKQNTSSWPISPAGTGHSRSSCCWSPASWWNQCRRRGGCSHRWSRKVTTFQPFFQKRKDQSNTENSYSETNKRSMKRIKLKKSCEINSKIDDTGNKKEFRNFF